MDSQKTIEKVRASLRSIPRLGPDFSPDRLELGADGVLLLEGEVDSVALKRLALEQAAALPEVSGILDRLRVRPASPMGDAEIRDHLRKVLMPASEFTGLEIAELKNGQVEILRRGEPQSPGRILTEVDAGIVTLNGAVLSLAAKRLAGVLAWWVPGSRDVINGLAVEPEEDAPIRIEEAVRIALEKDPFINASQVKVGVRGRVVHLTGLVTSAHESDMAENDAWYIFGVDNVLNDIAVGT